MKPGNFSGVQEFLHGLSKTNAKMIVKRRMLKMLNREELDGLFGERLEG